MKRVIAALAVLVVGCYAYVTLYAHPNTEVAMEKKVVLIVASSGFQEHEYQATRAALEHAGYAVTVACDKPGLATGHAEARVEVDTVVSDVHPHQYAAFYIIGGPGTLHCLDNDVTYKLLNEVFALQKPYGAICIAPRILANAHVLRNKKATGWNNDGHLEDIFSNNQVTYVHEPVVVDGTIVTADGPKAADDFGDSIVKILDTYTQGK